MHYWFNVNQFQTFIDITIIRYINSIYWLIFIGEVKCLLLFFFPFFMTNRDTLRYALALSALMLRINRNASRCSWKLTKPNGEPILEIITSKTRSRSVNHIFLSQLRRNWRNKTFYFYVNFCVLHLKSW